MCKIDDCSKPIFVRGWCAGHYHRWRRYGDPLGTPVRRAAVTYKGIHAKLAYHYGSASGHLCAWCLGPAAHWAYLHTDPDVQVGPSGPWSAHMAHYAPLCAECHGIFDDAARHTRAFRNSQVREAVASGQESLAQIGTRFGISRQRVHQIARGA